MCRYLIENLAVRKCHAINREKYFPQSLWERCVVAQMDRLTWINTCQLLKKLTLLENNFMGMTSLNAKSRGQL